MPRMVFRIYQISCLDTLYISIKSMIYGTLETVKIKSMIRIIGLSVCILDNDSRACSEIIII